MTDPGRDVGPAAPWLARKEWAEREAPETTTASPGDRILWRLEVKSAVKGVDFLAQFEVPVFYTTESDTPLTPEELARFG